MSKQDFPDFPEGAEGKAEEALWSVLGSMELEQPSARVRQEFYKHLEQHSRPGIAQRLRDLFGFSNNAGWLTAAACLILGIGAGQLSSSDDARLVALEQNISALNRNLVLDRLQNQQPGKRLRGVIDAAYLVESDPAIANTLLELALNDQVDSIRSAAVESLGEQISSPEIGTPLMQLLQNTESPLVQLALIDLVLRNGSESQINQLLELANNNLLYPDLRQHVLTSLNREIT